MSFKAERNLELNHGPCSSETSPLLKPQHKHVPLVCGPADLRSVYKSEADTKHFLIVLFHIHCGRVAVQIYISVIVLYVR